MSRKANTGNAGPLPAMGKRAARASEAIDLFSQAGANVILQINADDLRDIIRETVDGERRRMEAEMAARREQPTLTRKEAAKQLNLSEQTLLRWANDGFLIPVRAGRKILYRQSDIDELMRRKIEEGRERYYYYQ